MANIVNNYSSQIITIFQNVIRQYENNKIIIKQAEEETQDLLHEAEMSSPKDLRNAWMLYRNLRDARIRRRTAKEENELLKDMYDYLTSQPAQSFKSQIQKVQGNSAKIYSAQESRTYQPRQRDDLTITDKTADVTRPFEDLMREFKKTNVTMQGGKLRK